MVLLFCAYRPIDDQLTTVASSRSTFFAMKSSKCFSFLNSSSLQNLLKFSTQVYVVPISERKEGWTQESRQRSREREKTEEMK